MGRRPARKDEGEGEDKDKRMEPEAKKGPIAARVHPRQAGDAREAVTVPRRHRVPHEVVEGCVPPPVEALDLPMLLSEIDEEPLLQNKCEATQITTLPQTKSLRIIFN